MARLSIIFLVIVNLALVAPAEAQRVKRKGVTSPTRSKTPAPNPNTYRLEQFAGRWQEAFRTNRANESVELVDTFYLHVKQRNRVVTREGRNPYLTGTLQLEPNNILLAAADVFTIQSVTDSSMVLFNQDQYYHHFKKVDRFNYESEQPGEAPNVLSKNQVPESRTLEQLMGRWWMYKREAPPGEVSLDDPYIKSFRVAASADSLGYNGTAVVVIAQKSNEVPARISTTGSQILIETKLLTVTHNLYQAPANELVAGDLGRQLFFFRRSEE